MPKKSLSIQSTSVALASALICSAAPSQAAETLLFFDFFFGDNAGVPQDDFRNFFQWNVSGGSVDLVGGVGPGVFGAPPAEPNGRYVDLGGSTGNPGSFQTKLPFDLIDGATYDLSFMYRSTLPGDLNTATASFGGRSFVVSSSAETFQTFNQSFVVNTLLSSRLTFQGDENDRDNGGIGIDAVLLRLVLLPNGQVPTDPGLPLPTAVPEPATWATMLLGFGLAGCGLRQRRRTAALAA